MAPRLQFGVLQFFSWPGRRRSIPEVYRRAFERIDIMESSGGYEAVWLAEHHFTSHSVSPSVSMMGTHIAARTERLRIGTAVTLAPMYHPLRLAEEIALLDVLSDGRVNWGAGRGNDPQEFGVFGLDLPSSYARFRENVDIVLRAWQTDRLSYQGEFHSFDNVEVLPKPVQRPHPPVWLAASSLDAIEWSAKAGHSILMDPHSSHADIGVKYAAYRRGLRAAGHSADDRVTPMARLVAVAPTDAEAIEVAAQGAEWTVSSMRDPRRRGLSKKIRLASAEEKAQDTRSPQERYVQDVIIHGSPERVVEQIRRLREEIGLHYLMCAPLSHRSFLLFTEEVIPKLV
ncbi:hypothetical protein ALI144C_31865 [Actinosynnema sp. ALI-1.44]|uniref:LLM class flavin-dependent oxidoreductase n=1 Tax=Actinosynnema sp. ALI-1.44 TaxID=1933779 RepID=UPI00097C4ABF|nr:LLM class flavin-dependent oxidoreductase [Actinosynnema sp. ALI-1.44]ONI77992.1 hypothetical protein ALI144C_31865 [Actinosynnema sp. ALI-1.44]